jgi:putative drug exporter of the RND superfamily
LVRYNYDYRKSVGPSAPSSVGYAAMERHFPVSQAVPEYILISSPRDLRTPQALADLEQMAQRVSQLPNIGLVSGLTRPTGVVPQEFRATYQAGIVGDRMAAGSAVIGDNTKDLNRLQNGAGTLASSLGDVRAQINRIAPSMQRMIDALNSARSQFGGDKLVKQVETAAQLVASVNALGNEMGLNFSTVRDMSAWVGPVLAALNGNAICDANPSCSDTRIQFQKLMDARDDGRLNQINTLAAQLQSFGGKDSLDATVKQLNDTLSQFSSAVRSMGLDKPGGLQAGLKEVRQGANRLADGSKQVAGGVDQLVGQVKQMGAGLDEAAAFLLAMRNDAADPSMAGFNLPAQILQLDEFKAAAKIFISPDGHTARYLVQTTLNPFSADAMDQVNAISDAAKSAQPNTQLSDATISMGGFPAALRDTRDYYEHDIRFIIIVTLVVVLLILMALLRAVVAPLYLIGSVILSYFAALGISVLTFQYLLGQQLHWSVPPLAFVVLVAVGADYNLLFVSRMRDESPHGMRYGVIRTLTSTGGVITAAGLIFAASMCGLLFSSITTVVQGGFVIGVGVLLDTFLVRTLTVPAMATLVGRANWWPSRLSAPRSASPAGAGKAE